MMTESRLQQEMLINGQDVNSEKKITNKAIFELFSNITMYNGYLAGHTSNEGVSPVSWIVMGWKVQIFDRAKMFSKATVQTWVQDFNRIRATRNYLLFDEENRVMAKGSAHWVAMDGEKGTFLRLTPQLMEYYGTLPEEKIFPELTFPDIRNFENDPSDSILVKPGLQMADYNGHVHNSEYVNLAAEILPPELYSAVPVQIEVVYKQQILPGQEVLLEYSRCLDPDCNPDRSGGKDMHSDSDFHCVAVRNIHDHGMHALVRLKRI